jgi:hypothetical protein
VRDLRQPQPPVPVGEHPPTGAGRTRVGGSTSDSAMAAARRAQCSGDSAQGGGPGQGKRLLITGRRAAPGAG